MKPIARSSSDSSNGTFLTEPSSTGDESCGCLAAVGMVEDVLEESKNSLRGPASDGGVEGLSFFRAALPVSVLFSWLGSRGEIVGPGACASGKGGRGGTGR